MNKPNFIIKENVYDTKEEYEEFIQDYKNKNCPVRELYTKYGQKKYHRFYKKALKEKQIPIRKNKKQIKRETGIKNVTIIQRENDYVWVYYYDKRRITSKFLNRLQKRVQAKGYSWEVTDPEQLERVKREYNVQ